MTWRKLLLGICRKEGFRLKVERDFDDSGPLRGASFWSPAPGGEGPAAGWSFECGSGFWKREAEAEADLVRVWIGDPGLGSPEEAELRLTAMGYDFDSLDDPRIVRALVFDKGSSKLFGET